MNQKKIKEVNDTIGFGWAGPLIQKPPRNDTEMTQKTNETTAGPTYEKRRVHATKKRKLNKITKQTHEQWEKTKHCQWTK